MLKSILLADRLDRACAALERIADSLERANPPNTSQEEIHKRIREMNDLPLLVASNEESWLNEEAEIQKKLSVVPPIEEGEEPLKLQFRP
jgi:hypothetical protein